MRNIIWILFLCLSLGSCSPPPDKIIAEIENGKIIFHIRSPGIFFDKVFGWDDDKYRINSLYLFADKKIIWAFDMKGKDSLAYPIAYGQKIASSNIIMQPQKLQKNMKYEILIFESYDENFDYQSFNIDNIYYGAIGRFRLNSSGSVINLKPYQTP